MELVRGKHAIHLPPYDMSIWEAIMRWKYHIFFQTLHITDEDNIIAQVYRLFEQKSMSEN